MRKAGVMCLYTFFLPAQLTIQIQMLERTSVLNVQEQSWAQPHSTANR